MDEQFRNRLRRYDNSVPIRPRPDAPNPDSKAPLNLRAAQPKAVPQTPVLPSPSKQSVAPVQAPAKAKNLPNSSLPQASKMAFVTPPTSRVQKKAKSTSHRGRKPKKFLIIVLILVALVIAAALWFILRSKQQPSNSRELQTGVTDNSPANNKPPAPGKLIRFVALGDSVAYSSINQAAQRGTDYDYTPLTSALKPLLSKAAIRICSQTVPASGAAAGGVSGPPTFNAAPQFSKALETNGCNVIDMASSNANDKGQAGIDGSIANYDGHKNILALAGTNRTAEDQKKIHYFTVEGLKFAYLSYTTRSNVAPGAQFSVNLYSDALADAQIAEAHKNAGMVIVSMHWGTDFNQDIDASQDTISQHLASQNVDIVIGNGPRVIEPVKVLNGTKNHQSIVWFSLGNMLSSQLPVETLVGGMAVMDIDSATQQLHNPRLLPIYIHYEWTADQKARQSDADLLARKNFQVVPLDLAAPLLAKSQNNTTVQAQQDRVKAVINKYFTIPLITSTEL